MSKHFNAKILNNKLSGSFQTVAAQMIHISRNKKDKQLVLFLINFDCGGSAPLGGSILLLKEQAKPRPAAFSRTSLSGQPRAAVRLR